MEIQLKAPGLRLEGDSACSVHGREREVLGGKTAPEKSVEFLAGHSPPPPPQAGLVASQETTGKAHHRGGCGEESRGRGKACTSSLLLACSLLPEASPQGQADVAASDFASWTTP